MRWVVAIVAVAGCGRIGFDEDATPNGLVAYYPLDELINMRTVDEVANVDATCDGACPTLITGRVGNALRFQNERLDVPSTTATETTSAFTIAAWVSPESLPTLTFACAVTKKHGNTTANSWTICISQSAQVFFGAARPRAREPVLRGARHGGGPGHGRVARPRGRAARRSSRALIAVGNRRALDCERIAPLLRLRLRG